MKIIIKPVLLAAAFLLASPTFADKAKTVRGLQDQDQEAEGSGAEPAADANVDEDWSGSYVGSGGPTFKAKCKCGYDAIEELFHVQSQVLANIDWATWTALEGDIPSLSTVVDNIVAQAISGTAAPCSLSTINCRYTTRRLDVTEDFYASDPEDPECCCAVHAVMELYVSQLKAIGDLCPSVSALSNPLFLTLDPRTQNPSTLAEMCTVANNLVPGGP